MSLLDFSSRLRLFFLTSLLAFLLLPPSSRSDSQGDLRQIRVTKRPPPTSYALLIGISEYPNITPLEWAASDARRMAAMLQKLGFPKKNVRLLIDKEATKARMMKEMQWLQKVAQPQDRVVFFFSGHGTQVTDTDGDEADGCDEALAPYDTSANEPSPGKVVVNVKSLLLDDWIAVWLKGFQTKNLFLVFDSCFSGGITKSVGLSPSIPPGSKARFTASGHACGVPSSPSSATKSGFLAPSSSYVIFTGSDTQQYSFENKTIQAGVFTYLLLKSLSQIAKQPCATFDRVFREIRSLAKSDPIGREYIPKHQLPKFFGNSSLPLFFNEPLQATQRSCSSADPKLCATFSLTKKKSSSPQACFAIGDLIQVSVILTQPAYLAVCMESTQGEVGQLYPNPFDPSLRWPARLSHRFPPSQASSKRKLYNIRTTGPSGAFRAWLTVSASSQPTCGSPPPSAPPAPSGVQAKAAFALEGVATSDTFQIVLRTYAY